MASVRKATISDVEAILAIQEPGGIKGLSHLFPQDEYPFPRDALSERWRVEIQDPHIHVYVACDDKGGVIGFAAIQQNELLHFGTAVEQWGSGLAIELHEAMVSELRRLAPSDTTEIKLRVFAENHRATRFYEKLGWHRGEQTTQSEFPPYPILLEYSRPMDRELNTTRFSSELEL